MLSYYQTLNNEHVLSYCYRRVSVGAPLTTTHHSLVNDPGLSLGTLWWVVGGEWWVVCCGWCVVCVGWWVCGWWVVGCGGGGGGGGWWSFGERGVSADLYES